MELLNRAKALGGDVAAWARADPVREALLADLGQALDADHRAAGSREFVDEQEAIHQVQSQTEMGVNRDKAIEAAVEAAYAAAAPLAKVAQAKAAAEAKAREAEAAQAPNKAPKAGAPVHSGGSGGAAGGSAQLPVSAPVSASPAAKAAVAAASEAKEAMPAFAQLLADVPGVRVYFEDTDGVQEAARLRPRDAALGLRACVAMSTYVGLTEAAMVLVTQGVVPFLLGTMIALGISLFIFSSLAHQGGSREHALAGFALCIFLACQDLYVVFNPGPFGILSAPWYLAKAALHYVLCVNANELRARLSAPSSLV